MKFLSKFTKKLMLDYSPLERLTDHAEKVYETMIELPEAIEKYMEGERVNQTKISDLEHEADITKQDIRNNLPRSDLLMPVARTDVLSFLWQQDQIADSCQDAAMMLSLLPIDLSTNLSCGLNDLTKLINRSARVYLNMVEESSKVLTGSLTRKGIDGLWKLIDRMNELEHEADQIEGKLVKRIYDDQNLDAFKKYHLIQVVLKVGDAIDHMENAGEYLRIMTAR